MAAALSVSNLNRVGTASVSLTGDSATTARMLHITDPNGWTQNIPFTTSGSGAATLTFVPQSAGTHTFTVVSVSATVVSTTANSSHE